MSGSTAISPSCDGPAVQLNLSHLHSVMTLKVVSLAVSSEQVRLTVCSSIINGLQHLQSGLYRSDPWVAMADDIQLPAHDVMSTVSVDWQVTFSTGSMVT